MFTAALLSAVGVTCRFRACAYFTETNPYEHVYTEGLTEAGWYPLDITSRGSYPPIARSLYLEV
jgi:hypothetical protein